MKLIHQILVLDAALEQSLDESKMDELTVNLVDDLVHALGMEKLDLLKIYPATDLDFPGWSFVQPITTSHISGHYFEDKEGVSHIHVDVYSCKPFEWEPVIDVCHKYLRITDWSADFIDRDVDTSKRAALQLTGKGTALLKKKKLVLE